MGSQKAILPRLLQMEIIEMNQSKVKNQLKKSLTILVPAGLVPSLMLGQVNEIVQQYDLNIYLSTAQNIRLLNIKEADEQAIKDALLSIGVTLKGPGKFPLPRVCVGGNYCNLGLVDTMALSEKIVAHFADKGPFKPKFKIAISGCPASCSNVTLTDIGIRATQSGFEVFVGGKGGPKPVLARRIARGVDEEKVLEIIAHLVEFHTKKAGKKMRMSKLLSDPEFSFPEV